MTVTEQTIHIGYDPQETLPPVADTIATIRAAGVEPGAAPPGYPLGVALGAFGVFLAALGFALYGQHTGDPRLADVSMAVVALSFLSALAGSHIHQRRTRRPV